ncbi:MAG: hypothetical protein V4592_24720 [Bacteroidota bacterium]
MKFINLTPLLFFVVITSAFAQSKGSVSPYIFPEFVKASVLQKGGGVTEASMNYNTLTQEMLFLQGDVKTVLDQNNVDTIFLQDRKFIPAGTVYYEKLTDTKIALYIQHFNKMLVRGKNPDLDEQANNTITAAQGFKNAFTSSSKYDAKLSDGYTLEPHSTFWLQKGKSFNKISDLKGILKLFPPNKEQSVNAYIKDNKLDITQPADLAKLIVFCNLP